MTGSGLGLDIYVEMTALCMRVTVEEGPDNRLEVQIGTPHTSVTGETSTVHLWFKHPDTVIALGHERDGVHALRHFYTPVLLDAGESIKALSEWLGHSDPAFTMRVYTHLMPASAERARQAIDRVLGGGDGPTTMKDARA